jgi:hypothetical protein
MSYFTDKNNIKPINLELSDSDNEIILFQEYLYEKMWEWINDNMGIPEIRMSKPCDRSIKEQKQNIPED